MLGRGLIKLADLRDWKLVNKQSNSALMFFLETSRLRSQVLPSWREKEAKGSSFDIKFEGNGFGRGQW